MRRLRSTRYQLCVVARDVGELVDLAGGWGCDRILAGRDVIVAVSEARDLRPLQILGVTTVVTHQRFGSINDGTASITVAPGIFENNDQIRGLVLQALDQGAIEVIFWGPSIPSDLHGQPGRRQHRLSGAARAFKAHVLAAARFPAATIGSTEDMYGTEPWYDASSRGPNRDRLAALQREEGGIRAVISGDERP